MAVMSSAGARQRQEVALERWYPERIMAGSVDDGVHDGRTIGFLHSSHLATRDKADVEIAEFGIWKGGTSLQFARFLEGKGRLHLFDYHDNVATVATKLAQLGFHNVTGWGSSYKALDSYNWSLRNLIAESRQPRFDYVYLDGAHTWAIDALTFFLCDLLLKPGGYIDFDDYGWRLRNSSLDPSRVAMTGQMYTDEQIDALQVRDIVELLVRPRRDYVEVVPNKIFRKLSGDGATPSGNGDLRTGFDDLPGVKRRIATTLGLGPGLKPGP
jgi:hypothetical protein